MNNRNRTLIISAIIWVVLATIFVITGFIISGEDVLAWFGSKWAIMVYTFMGVYALVVVIFVVIPMIRDSL